MKKDDLIKGIDAVDDDLIAEAAGREPKLKYKTKVRLIRFLTGAAAVAAMVGTGFLLKASLGKAPKSDDKAAAIVTEGSEPGDPEVMTENGNAAPGTDTSTVTSAVTSRAEEYVTYAKTTTKAGKETVTAVMTSTKKITMPETTVSTVTTDVPWTEDRPFTFSNNEFFAPMKDFQWEAGIVNVQFGTAVLRDRGVWVNCSYEQADRILSMLHFLKPSEIRLRLGVYSDKERQFAIIQRFDHAVQACNSLRNKSSGSTDICIYDNTMAEKEVFNAHLLQEFEAAIEQKQFKVVYQPKFNIKGEKPVLCRNLAAFSVGDT